MKKLFHLTKEGVSELQAELDDLTALRPELAERIKSAREFGDLAENAEYTSARAEQEKVEVRISEIEHILQNVDVIKKGKVDGKVQLGSVVQLKDASNRQKQFQVVGTVEADPLNGKISDESPIGKALMNRKVGDDVEIVTPAETSNYKVVSIG
jgi:transcription elongation factor GreA